MVDVSHLFAERYIQNLIAKALELDIHYNSAYYIPRLQRNKLESHDYSISKAWEIKKGSFHDKLGYITKLIEEDYNTKVYDDPTVVYRTPVWLVLLIWNDARFFDIFGSYYTPISYTVILHMELLQKKYGVGFYGLENYFWTEIPERLSGFVSELSKPKQIQLK